MFAVVRCKYSSKQTPGWGIGVTAGDDTMAGPQRTTVGRIATQIVNDIHGTVQKLPVIAEALDHRERTVRMSAMWALCMVAEFKPETVDPVSKYVSRQAAVEAQYVVDILSDYHGDGAKPDGHQQDDRELTQDPDIEFTGSGVMAERTDGAAGTETTETEAARAETAEAETADVETAEARATTERQHRDPVTPPKRVHPDAEEVVETVVEEMWKGPQRTPSLIRLLDHDTRHVRLTALWGLVMIAEHHPTNVRHLAARVSQQSTRESDYLVGMLNYYHDIPGGDTGNVEVALAAPEEKLEGNLWGPYITYPKVEDRVVGEQSNTFTPNSSVLQAVSAIDLVGLSRHERTYIAAGTVNNEYRKFNLHTYVPDGRYEIKDYQRNFQPAVDGWTSIDQLENVATVFDYGRTPHPWIATDYLPRPIWEVGQLSPRMAVDITVTLCDAVSTMHEGGVAHGGITPWSIGLVQTSAEYVPKLTRVGIATHLGDGRALRLDERFAPPEAVTDEYGSVGRLSDVYGLGVTLYRLLTGNAPPYPRNLDGDYVPIDVPDPSTMVPDLPETVDEVVRTATATEKPWRFETVSRMGQELRSTLPDNDRR